MKKLEFNSGRFIAKSSKYYDNEESFQCLVLQTTVQAEETLPPSTN